MWVQNNQCGIYRFKVRTLPSWAAINCMDCHDSTGWKYWRVTIIYRVAYTGESKLSGVAYTRESWLPLLHTSVTHAAYTGESQLSGLACTRHAHLTAGSIAMAFWGVIHWRVMTLLGVKHSRVRTIWGVLHCRVRNLWGVINYRVTYSSLGLPTL